MDFGQVTRSIKRRDLEALYRLAELSYPYECCGVITVQGSARDAAERVHPCPNIADGLHAMNPELHSRDARTSYVLGGKSWLAIFTQISEGEVLLKAIYHSHVDSEAFFSAEDRARALGLEDPPQPLFPEAFYIVLSVYRGKINHVMPYRAFQWSSDQLDFAEVDVAIEA